MQEIEELQEGSSLTNADGMLQIINASQGYIQKYEDLKMKLYNCNGKKLCQTVKLHIF